MESWQTCHAKKYNVSIGSVQTVRVLWMALQVEDQRADDQEDHALLGNGQGVKMRRGEILVVGPRFHARHFTRRAMVGLVLRANVGPSDLKRGDFRGDFVAPTRALLHTVGSERSRKLLKNKGLKLAPLHGVQGVASSNPAVPTSSSKGRQ